MKNPVTILFDLDGTLLDTIADLRDSLNAVLAEHGLPTHTTESVKQFVGNGMTKLIERAVPNGLAHPDFQEIEAQMRTHYAKNCERQTAPYLGISDLLRVLSNRNYTMAVISNKPDAQVKALCKRFFPDSISVAIGQSETIAPKPAPDSVLAAMKQLNASPERTVYVGDSEVDILTARNARIPCISVLWGFRTKEILLPLSPDFFAETPSELLSVIRTMG